MLHGDWKESHGYRIDTPTRSAVISGDPRPSEALIAAARKLDVLVHQIYSSPNRSGGTSWR